MIGNQLEGTLPGIVLRATLQKGIRVEVNGKRGSIAVIDSEGRIRTVGPKVAAEAQAMSINSLHSSLKGDGHVRIYGRSLEAINGVVFSSVVYENIRVEVDGQLAQLAVVTKDGGICAAGEQVAIEIEHVSINCYRRFLIGKGYLKVYPPQPGLIAMEDYELPDGYLEAYAKSPASVLVDPFEKQKLRPNQSAGSSKKSRINQVV